MNKIRNITKKFFCLMIICALMGIGVVESVKAADMASIVLTYGEASYTTTVYGPEIANINSGMTAATTTWITEICNHVYSSTFQTVKINQELVQTEVLTRLNKGESLVSLDLKDYIVGQEKSMTAQTSAAGNAVNPVAAASGVSTGMNAVIAANLNKIGIDSKISECTTKYVVGQDRSKNIAVAASRLNGMILPSGSGISVNTVILPRTKENGYGMGNAIVGDEFIKVVGGGICQVSSTLNTAVLRAGIVPYERHNHSQNVSYLASGLDATISSGAMDYQFVNTLPYPIYIEATTEGGILKVALYSNSKALNGITYQTDVVGSKKKNSTYIVGSINGIEITRVKAYSSNYK